MIVGICIFLIILFVYLHIIDQYKRNEDLEIMEMDYQNNAQMQNVCNIKQPFLFDFTSIQRDYFTDITIPQILKNNDMEIKLKDRNEYYRENSESVDYLLLPIHSCYKIIEIDSKSHYYTEHNDDAINDTELVKHYKSVDTFLKPYYTVQTKYDFIIGSKQCTLPARYHCDYRYYLCVSSGRINIKMTPFKSSKYLHTIYDYENYEFRSPVDVWNPQDDYKKDCNKIQWLEFDVNEGYMLYIPPYWWYSIRLDNVDTLVTTIQYNTPMNIVANSKHWSLYYLQQMNIHRKILHAKKTIIVEDEASENESIASEENESEKDINNGI